MEEVELATNNGPTLMHQNPAPEMGEPSNSSKKKSISFLGLFSAADSIDYVLMFFGSIGACIHGAALPVFFVLFGRMIDSLGHLSEHPHMLSSRVSEVQDYCNFRRSHFENFFLFSLLRCVYVSYTVVQKSCHFVQFGNV